MAATRKTLLLNLSANQVRELEHFTNGEPIPRERWRDAARLVKRGLMTTHSYHATGALTEFGSCALAAYRAAEKASLLKDVE
jgi:hypothetical protein